MTIENFQPRRIDDIIFADREARETIFDLVGSSVPFPCAYASGILLYGAWGTGKTTLAKLLPEEIEYGRYEHGLIMPYQYFACQEVTTSANIIGITERQLKTQSLNASGTHYFIFDEADMLSKNAQASLKSIMNTTRGAFILTTNNITKIDRGVRDRCIEVAMNAAEDTAFLPLAHDIASHHNAAVSDSDLLQVIAGKDGSLRKIVRDVDALCRRLPKLPPAKTTSPEQILEIVRAKRAQSSPAA